MHTAEFFPVHASVSVKHKLLYALHSVSSHSSPGMYNPRLVTVFTHFLAGCHSQPPPFLLLPCAHSPFSLLAILFFPLSTPSSTLQPPTLALNIASSAGQISLASLLRATLRYSDHYVHTGRRVWGGRRKRRRGKRREEKGQAAERSIGCSGC